MPAANSRAFSQRLSQNVDSLRERFEIEVTSRQNTACYAFRPLIEV